MKPYLALSEFAENWYGESLQHILDAKKVLAAVRIDIFMMNKSEAPVSLPSLPQSALVGGGVWWYPNRKTDLIFEITTIDWNLEPWFITWFFVVYL